MLPSHLPGLHGIRLSFLSPMFGPLTASLTPTVSQIAMYGYRGGALGGVPEFGVSDVFSMPGLQSKVLSDVEQIRRDLQAKGIIDSSRPTFSVPIPKLPPIDRRDTQQPTPPFIPPVVSIPDGLSISKAIKDVITGGISVAAPKPTPPPLVISPSASKAGQAEGVKITKTPAITTTEKTMDLGDILGTAVGLYKDYQVATSIPQYVDYKYGGPAVQTPALNVPFVDVIPEQDGMKGMVWNPRANCGQGKWVKQRKRRRRRLATVSDIKDLAALKSVLGGGKAFETWIATHSS